MPDNVHSRTKLALEGPPNPPAPFIELGVTTPFSFLRGASEAKQLAMRAYALRFDAIGVADRNTLAGVVRMHSAAKGAKMRPLIGCRLDLADAPSLLAYPIDREGYGRLSRLLSLGKMRSEKGECHLLLSDVADHQEGIAFIAWPPDELDGFEEELRRLRQALPVLRHIAAAHLYRGDDLARIERLDRMARGIGGTILATNDVHYHAPEQRPLQDVMTCIREKTTISQAGFLLHANAERHLKSSEEMARLFARWPHAISATRAFADAIGFSLDELRYEYPRESVPEGRTPQAQLEHLTWQGAESRWPAGIPAKVREQLRKELGIIAKLDYARYFLTVHAIVAYAESIGILCQGRGSAANSSVCYCLRITNADPAVNDLLFERFLSEERKEPPDIDVDFEHERREEVIQHIYRKYGRDRAGIAATVIHYRPRSAVREVGKVMGLSEDVCGALASMIWGAGGQLEDARAEDAGLDLSDPHLKRTIRLAQQMVGMPRHLSQHVGGFILTERPLTETVPIGNGAMDERTFIEWDKDDIDDLGILKIDVLGLGMLTCIRKAFDLVEEHHGERWELGTVPREEPQVYDMLCRGDSLGVFQVESRAQMNMLPRLRPREFYDLAIQIAIVRPGPIQGDMVHPYLKRRSGKEKVAYPSPSPEHGDPDELERILDRTLGVPIFQEQAMKIALDAAKFSAEEANELRKAMATFRSRGTISELEELMVGRMVERGYDREFAQRCFDQIKGFGEYGFPESHAISFAHLAYISTWLKWRYPAAFAGALLNSQPMGFYAPAQIVRDAREHGVEVRPVDVNHSEWDCTLESGALRLGLRQIEGFHRDAGNRLMAKRARPYRSVEELRSRGRLPVHAIERLAEADAFRSIGLDRRAALWDARALKPALDLPLFVAADTRDEGEEIETTALPAMPLSEHVVSDYQTVRLSLKAHPMQFLRHHYTERGFIAADQLKTVRNGRRVQLAGLILTRQRPGSAKGVCFITLEDETGIANLIVWQSVFDEQRMIVMGARLLVVDGIVQRDSDSEVIHVVVRKLEDGTPMLQHLSHGLMPSMLNQGDAGGSLRPPPARHPRDVDCIPRSRDFH